MYYTKAIQSLTLSEAVTFVQLLNAEDCNDLIKATMCNNYTIRKYEHTVYLVFIDKL